MFVESGLQSDCFTLDSLIAWLEQQPSRHEYNYYDNLNCLLAQYFTAMGLHRVYVGPTAMCSAETGLMTLPPYFDKIAKSNSFWFGHRVGYALKTARKFQLAYQGV